MQYHIKKYPNGLTLLEVPSSEAESVTVDLYVKAGSRFETPEEHGMAHFLEHFLFKGTEKYPTPLAISELVDGFGGEMNAMTGKESTQYYIKAAAVHLETIFEVLTDMLQNPLLNQAELEREKGVIVEEINMYKDNPSSLVSENYDKLHFGAHPLGREIGGVKESVTSFTPEMFKAFLSKVYSPTNLIIGVAGKFESAKVKQLVEKFWENLPSKDKPSFESYSPTAVTQRISLHTKETEQAHFILGLPSLHQTDPDVHTLSVLTAVLSGGMSSRLFTEVREKRGLCYYVRAGSNAYEDTGVFGVSAGVQVGKLSEALTVIWSELEKISTVLVDEKELIKAKEYLKGRTTLALEDSGSKLDWFLDEIATKEIVETPAEVFAKIDQVTSEMIQILAKKLFVKDLLKIAVVGPYSDTKEIESALGF